MTKQLKFKGGLTMVTIKILDENRLTPCEVADLLGREVDTIYRWLRSGKISGFRIFGRWQIPQSSVAEIIDRDQGDPS